MRTSAVVLSLAAVLAAAPAAAQPESLAALYALGGAVSDTNGDGVADRLNARVVLPGSPSAAEVAIAADLAARLGFETLALDLPFPTDAEMEIAVGDEALSRLGLSGMGDLSAGQGAVELHTAGDSVVVAVRGGDDAGLAAAAAWLASRAPHVFGTDGESLGEVEAAVMSAAGDAASAAHTVRVEVEAGANSLAAAEVRVAAADAAAANAVTSAVESAGDDLRFDSLATLRVVAAHDGGESEASVSHDPPAPEPGPVPGRPGSGAKDDLRLAALYEPDGLLGDSNGDRIPDRLDSRLAVTAEDPGGTVALAARLGLESSGMDFPVAAAAGTIDEPDAAPTLVVIGTAGENPLLADLAVPELGAGEGFVGVIPEAFGKKPAVAITGGDQAGLSRALYQTAVGLPHLDAANRAKDHPTVDAVEFNTWKFLTQRSPGGQAAAALYKLERIAAEISHLGVESSKILLSVKDPAPGLDDFVAAAAERLGLGDASVELDDRNVDNAAVIHEEEFAVPSEVEEFRGIVQDRLLPAVGRGDPVRVTVFLSEPAAVRHALRDELVADLRGRGATVADGDVVVLSAYRQGYSWIEEVVLPRLLALREDGTRTARVRLLFREHRPPPDWPQQAMHTPLRWQHAMFPADEIMAEALALDLGDVGFELRAEPDAPAYQVVAEGADGEVLLNETFEPRLVSRPFFDRYPDYELIQVATGGITAEVDGETVVDERIRMDAEAFWDHYQSDTLARVYDYIMELHDGKPRGPADAPYFGQLKVVLSLSEPERLLGVEQEVESTHDALHEDIYFVTHSLLRHIGRNSLGTELTYGGRVIPEMRGKTDGTPGTAHILFTGFKTSRPAIVVDYTMADGSTGTVRRNIPKVEVGRPKAMTARVSAGNTGLDALRLRVKVDTDADERDYYVERHGEDDADERIMSAGQVTRVMELLGELRGVGLYSSELAFAGLGDLEIAASWTWDHEPDTERTVTLAANGEPPPLPDIMTFRDATGSDDQLVQWDSPISPPEAYGILARMSEFPEATVYQIGESYLGQSTWAMDLMPPMDASHWSQRKASLLKPTIVYSARQHANEVSSTSHVLRLAEMLLTDPERKQNLDKVNIVFHPVQNPDGAQLAWDMHQYNRDHILHAGYWGSLGIDSTTDSNEPMPIYPEAEVRPRLWRMWLPDIFLNPHGYPAHQLVQLFSEFSGLVRAGRRTERNWGFNKGWFMPGFDVVDDPELPRHKDAAIKIRGYITNAIQDTDLVRTMNERTYDRYRRYGMQFEPEVFHMDLHNGVNIQMPIKGRRASAPGRGGRGYDPKITIWAGGTEAPDEPAYGDWMEVVASAGLAWDTAVLQYLLDGDHQVNRNTSEFFGGVSIRLDRPRPPEESEDEEEE